MRERAGARVWSGIRTSEVKHFVTSELAKRTPQGFTPDKSACGR